MKAAIPDYMFQHTAARRRLDCDLRRVMRFFYCFNTQPPEGGWSTSGKVCNAENGFNTQPPEGGWFKASVVFGETKSFNTQPPEGGWQAVFLF